MKVDIIIPNYNGSHLLSLYLPVLVKGCGSAQITVVDDASSDDSLEMLRKQFPQIKVIAGNRNAGFSHAVNDGIRETSGDIVVLLNNDIEITPQFLDPILPHFDDENLFAVTPQILLPSKGNLDEGPKTGFWRHGMFYIDQKRGVEASTPVLYATGCAAAYRRSMLEQLGGFDEAYSPFYWEDVDLGYRAWKRGWMTLYEPNSKVYHQHSASISRLNAVFVDAVRARNGLLFIWRNIEDESLQREHKRWLPMVLTRRVLAGNGGFVQGWRAAWARRSEAAEARDRDSANRKLSDIEILQTVGIET